MTDRRQFLKMGVATAVASTGRFDPPNIRSRTMPIVISTWDHGVEANDAAWLVLANGGTSLDAVETGVRVTEADPRSRTVGLGGRPDAKGHVTLDACIMDGRGRCGSVAFLQHILHPVSVARKVMEVTPHVMLAGDGALEFALEQGFERENLLTPESEAEWRTWLEENGRTTPPAINVENHDTIGALALDVDGNLSGACTTSGAQYKLHGRIGDSPIIGAGLFVDDEVGAACATGWGEAVIRIAGSHLVVELMRQGREPEDACRIAVERVIRRNPDVENLQVGFLALDRTGRFGAYAVEAGFEFAVCDADGANRLLPSPHQR